jgi:kynurenine formamidase
MCVLLVTVKQLLDAFSNARAYDLAQPYFIGMPHYPAHPPFLFSLTKKHGDLVLDGDVSSAADAITFGGHVGTHIDALSHFSCGGRLYGNIEAEKHQSYAGGVSQLSVDTIAPILRRGVLLDVAGYLGLKTLPVDFEIAPEHFEAITQRQKIAIQPGDAVLLRTGWARYFDDPRRFITGGKGPQPAGPGPGLRAARWLSERHIFCAGSDTVAFEKVPSGMPVHVHLLVESGIHIVEMLNLEELARDRVYEFLFIAAPLKIRGGTGSPIRPLALVSWTAVQSPVL